VTVSWLRQGSGWRCWITYPVTAPKLGQVMRWDSYIGTSLIMLNLERRRQFLDLMSESHWDVLLLYGHSWRKDFFRSLINFNFFGPHAVAALTRSNEISIVVSHPWDHELLRTGIDADVSWDADFTRVLRRFASSSTAIAGR